MCSLLFQRADKLPWRIGKRGVDFSLTDELFLKNVNILYTFLFFLRQGIALSLNLCAVVRSWPTAASDSWAQAIIPPWPPRVLGLRCKPLHLAECFIY